MTLDEALATPGPLVAAWESWTARADRALIVFSVRSKVTLVATIAMPNAERDQLSEELRRRGVRVGTFSPHDDHFWCVDEQGFTLWSMSAGLELEGKAGDLKLADGRRASAPQIRSVTSFVENEMVARGVRLDLVDGSSLIVARDEDLASTVWTPGTTGTTSRSTLHGRVPSAPRSRSGWANPTSIRCHDHPRAPQIGPSATTALATVRRTTSSNAAEIRGVRALHFAWLGGLTCVTS